MPDKIHTSAKVLLPVAKALSLKVRRVYKERRAGKMPVSCADDLLEKGMDRTLDRLVNGKADDAWWGKILNICGHKLISPEFLRIHAVQEWLLVHQVQTDLKSLSREQIMGKDDYEQDTLKRLRQTYTAKTGEDGKLADGPVEVIVAIIAAGYLGSISSEIEPVAGMIQDHAKESHKSFQKYDESLGSIDDKLKKLSPDFHVVRAHNQNAQKKLNQLLKRRSLEPDRTLQEIIALANRVVGGDLTHAENSIKAKVFYWAARLHASKAATLPLAKEYLEKIREIDPGTDTRIIEALILETEGDVDGALRILRDINDSDGRSTFFIVCNRKKGIESALLWFDEQSERNNPDFFTGIGWFNLAIILAKKERWEEAAEHLAVAHDYYEEWPDIAFVEGIVNAALLLPEEMRRHALEMNIFHSTIRTIEGAEADQYRSRSKACFSKANKLFLNVDLKYRAQASLDWHLWLRLTDPNPVISQTAKQEVVEGMREGSMAADLIPFARAFGLQFDEGPVKRHLALRKKTGGLENREVLAELFLAEMKMSPKERVDFIQKEEGRLSKVVMKSTLSGLLIEALVADGQTKRAREKLEKCKDDFIENDYQRLQTLIDAEDGADPRAKLEDIYTETESLIDLKNLISHLKRVGDWDALQPRLEDLFQKEKTAANALILTYCFRRNTKVGLLHILKFLEDNHDLVDNSDELLSEKAWTLSHAGRLKEADEINIELLKRRDKENDLELNMNIALQLGDWGRFSVIIDDALKRREKLGPHVLIRLASLAAEIDADADRAIGLAKMAVDKGIDDPQILMQAYIVTVQLGREDQTSGEWFAKAIDLSSEDGPLMKIGVRTLAEEMMPAHRERVRAVEQALMKGEVALQAAANNFGQTLSGILVEISKINTDIQDGRRRTIVPIRSGVRANVEMKPEWKVCFDITSILVLYHLNLFEKTANAFEEIMFDPDVMIFLLNERRDARFQQPSRVKRAENFRSLVDQDLLEIIPSVPETSIKLINEVGRELAEMLIVARKEGGLVIKPFPIFKNGSFMEKEADLGDYADLIISTKTFLKVLYEKKGMFDSGTFDRAYQYLSAQDRCGESNGNQLPFDCPLYLDDLSITYLQHVDILNAICNSDLQLYVHPTTVTFQATILEENRGGLRLADTLNDIRVIIRKTLEDGKARFLSRPRQEDKDEKLQFFYQIAPTIANLMEDTGDCDAVCVDDRFFNKNRNLSDKKDRSIPFVCVTDILQHLATQGIISKDQMHIGLHKLRQAGFAFTPMPFEEIEWYLDNARWDKDCFLIESAEMRMMRQTLMRIRSLDMAVLPEESPFLNQIQLGCVLAIRNLWSNESVPIEKAAELSNWTWRNIAPCPLGWVRDFIESNNQRAALLAFVQHHNLLLKPMKLNHERYEAFLQWLEDNILAPLLPANGDLVDALADLVKKDIKQMVGEFCNNDKDLIAEHLCNHQPYSVRSRLLKDKKFISNCNLISNMVMTIGGKIHVNQNKMLSAVKRALKHKRPSLLPDVDGKEYFVRFDHGHICVESSPKQQEARLDNLLILSPNCEERTKTLRQVIVNLGPMAPDFSGLLTEADKGMLSYDQIGELLGEFSSGVAALQNRAKRAFDTHQTTLENLVPNSLAYYDCFCGPNPGNIDPEEYFGSVLPIYRKSLIQRDIKDGLYVCLQGALRDDLMPGAWTTGYSDQELWDCLMLCDPFRDPFVLLGALDIALWRQNNERYVSFAEKAVTMLVKDEFLRSDGIDVYELLPIIAGLILNRINVVEGGALRPPYWKRMCAWMQAGFLIRQTQNLAFDLGSLKHWITANMSHAGHFACMIDLQPEPMFQSAEISRSYFRKEVLSRLSIARNRHKTDGRDIPNADDIDNAISMLISQGLPLDDRLPGPLEGYSRPVDKGVKLSAKEIKHFSDEFFNDQSDKTLSILIYLSQIFDLGGDILAKVREVVAKTKFDDGFEGFPEPLKRIIDIGFIAGAHRDVELSCAIGTKIVSTSSLVNSDYTVENIIRALLIAGSAFQKEDEWAEWLKKRLAEVAYRLPNRDRSKEFLSHIQELKKVLNLKAGIHSQAEAISSAAT